MNPTAKLEKEIEETVNKAMQTWKVPGLALAVVKDDRVLLSKGYGSLDMDKPGKVDEHTLFAIGSNTKSFTAAAMALLVQEGKVGWDDPVTKYLPAFKLHDPHATELMTIRDLLCHRSGLGTWAGDVLLLSSYPTVEVVRRLQYIPPEYSFRAGYGYSNLMFITAGLVIETVSGLSWDDFIRERIFKPLGMTDSVTNPRYFAERTNIATPHEDVKGNLQTVAYRQDAHVGAAGSICASVADLALWMRLQLNQGSLEGKRLLDPGLIEEMHTPHTPIKLTAVEKKLFPSRHFSVYGLGWFLSDSNGRLTVRHTGGVDGMLSNMILIPEEKLGIAIFTNKLPNAAYIILGHFLIEKMLGLDPRDWVQTYIELEKQGNAKTEAAKQQVTASRAKNTRPSFDLEDYAGDYDSLILGGAALRVEGSALHIQLQAHKSISGTLEHWHYDTFLCKWDDPVLGESLIPFISDGQGRVIELHVKIREDWIDPLEHVFKKIKPQEKQNAK
ncbi:MAG: serine hydrolase [Chloroflexi bacterium]|nr:serine hydrolase [Chloroflexota bacterium]